MFEKSTVFDVFLNFFLKLSYSVVFNNEIHILIASAGKTDKNRAVVHLLCKLDTVCYCMRAFDSGDDTLKTGKLEECIYRFLVTYYVVFYSAEVTKECVSGPEEG